MVIRSEGAVEYVMVGVSRRPTQAVWRGKEIEPVQVIVMSFDPVKIVVASELKQFEFNGIEITEFTCNIIKKENRGETVSINMNFSIMMNCPTDRETDGRELCLKDRVKILNFKEICFKGRAPKKIHTAKPIIWTDNSFTIKKQIFKGCPQGSVLSPTLWNIYFNPIISFNSELFLLQAFADDLAVVSFGLSRKELEDNTNKILSLVNSKLSELNLSIATAKTISVVFRCPFFQCRGFRGSTTFRRNPIFKIGSNSIHISKSYKYLGVNIDNRLSWTPHINSIKDKIIWISSNFYRVSKNFNHRHISVMKLWYTSVVQPIISYGAGVWGGSLTSIQIQKLKSIQRIYLLKITIKPIKPPLLTLSISYQAFPSFILLFALSTLNSNFGTTGMISFQNFVDGLQEGDIQKAVRMADVQDLKSALFYFLKVEAANEASCRDSHSVRGAE
ncbi:retrovirus-related Pol polyprotein from type-1 retrotransposable element R1 [Trichonephila clavipes]|nr:retrovirus-related Pol polyprotein from type-1 retrotransposable element R1 [Trichonephila clavipes]